MSKVTSNEPAGRQKPLSVDERLRLFDEATRRIRGLRWKGKPPKDRGWTREGLYRRARSR